MNPWSQFLGSTLSNHVKKYLFDILKERFHRNEDFIDRLAAMLTTSKDIEGFGRLISDLYEIGYLKSLEDHRKQLEQKGFKAIIKPDLPPEVVKNNTIFPQAKEG